MSQPPIQPRTLRGFRDQLPRRMFRREAFLTAARHVMQSYGFAPISTPALEYEEILLGKGGDESDRQTYRFVDHGGRQVGLRFDLTVPLARFAAQHAGALHPPVRLYHVGRVWRGENTQRGRYREFTQCDFDVIGVDAGVADAELVVMVKQIFDAAGVGPIRIRINSREVLGAALAQLDLAGVTAQVLRIVDKLEKVGRDRVVEELQTTTGMSDTQVDTLLELVGLQGSADVLDAAAKLLGDDGRTAVDRLAGIYDTARAVGDDGDWLTLDLSIARGLDYYTGLVLETQYLPAPEIGSVCSGGRYDELTGVYSRDTLPGVGASIGIDRLLDALLRDEPGEERYAQAPVLVAVLDQNRMADYLLVANRLRAAGFGVEVYPGQSRLGSQLKYAARRGYRVAVIVGDDEWAAGVAQLRDLDKGESTTVPLDDLTATVAQLVP
jgi:histidyl-tRNA synthetase